MVLAKSGAWGLATMASISACCRFMASSRAGL